MHVSGKILLGLAIVLALVDTYLATILMGHQRHWQEQIEGKREQVFGVDGVSGLKAEVAESRERVIGLRNEVNRIKNTWGDTYLTSGQPAGAASGGYQVNVGQAQGIAPPPADGPPVHVYPFTLNADGSSVYLGDFTLVDVQRDASSLQMTRPPLDGEETTWAAGNVRLRENVPPAWRQQMTKIYEQRTKADQRLDSQQHLARNYELQMEKAQEALDQRLAELNGDPDPPEGASQDVIDGLVLTIRQEETLRDAQNEELNRLRHEFARKLVQLNELLAENKAMVQTLPGYEESLEKPPERTRESVATSGGE